MGLEKGILAVPHDSGIYPDWFFRIGVDQGADDAHDDQGVLFARKSLRRGSERSLIF
jgi:hypothetical protein